MSKIVCRFAIQIEIMRKAIQGAIATRGENKGMLKAKCPAMNTPEAAAWCAIMERANPYKVGMGHLIMMDEATRAIYTEIGAKIDTKGIDVRGLDRDRVGLEKLGVW